MGTTFLGDIQSGAVMGDEVSHASAASDGANAAIRAIGANNWRAPQNITIVSAWWEATGADSAAANASSYRTLQIINAGSSGTGTTALASLNLTASLGSNTQRAMTMAPTPSASTGEVIAASHLTVGGAHSAGTVLVAGNFRFAYRPI